MPPFRALVHACIVRPLLWIFFGVTIEGKENLSGLSQFIIAANHNSHLDALLLYSILSIRQTQDTDPVAARDYFSKSQWFFKVVDWLLRPIWIDRVHKSGDPVDEIIRRMDEGRNIIIFPEGTRGEPGQIQEFKTGIGRILEARPSIPVVPVFLQGPERSLPRSAAVPLPLWNHVVVGHPQLFNGEPGMATATLKMAIENIARSFTRTRHRRAPEHAWAFTVTIMGIDGSGKSTLSRGLARLLSESATTCVISDTLELYEHREPKPMQPLLVEKAREWIGRQAKQAKSLARYKIPKLTELLLRDRLLADANRWYRPDVIVMDGCPLLNMTAWAALYREDHFNEEFCAKAITVMSSRGAVVPRKDPLLKQFPELSYLTRLGFDRLNIPDVVLFLDVAPEEAMRRIEARGERKQIHETEEKLGRLREAYLLVCRVVERERKAAVHRLNGAASLEEVTKEADDFLRETRLRHESHQAH